MVIKYLNNNCNCGWIQNLSFTLVLMHLIIIHVFHLRPVYLGWRSVIHLGIVFQRVAWITNSN